MIAFYTFILSALAANEAALRRLPTQGGLPLAQFEDTVDVVTQENFQENDIVFRYRISNGFEYVLLEDTFIALRRAHPHAASFSCPWSRERIPWGAAQKYRLMRNPEQFRPGQGAPDQTRAQIDDDFELAQRLQQQWHEEDRQGGSLQAAQDDDDDFYRRLRDNIEQANRRREEDRKRIERENRERERLAEEERPRRTGKLPSYAIIVIAFASFGIFFLVLYMCKTCHDQQKVKVGEYYADRPVAGVCAETEFDPQSTQGPDSSIADIFQEPELRQRSNISQTF